MKNPWEDIPLSLYEAHMSGAQVCQLQTLNRIMRGQLLDTSVRSAAIWGVAGGNGLEHAAQSGIETLYGVDISRDYLEACRARFGDIGGRLRLVWCDLCEQEPPQTELVIANLLVEYIGVDLFVQRVKQAAPRIVSCVIQRDEGECFVSDSPQLHAFDGLSAVHTQVEERALSAGLYAAGLLQNKRMEFPLPNGKKLIRLDYIQQKDSL